MQEVTVYLVPKLLTSQSISAQLEIDQRSICLDLTNESISHVDKVCKNHTHVAACHRAVQPLYYIKEHEKQGSTILIIENNCTK